MNATFNVSFLALLALCLLAAPAGAAGKPKSVKYVPPEGFAGRTWGETRSSFDRLPQEPIGVGAAYILAQEKQQFFTCVPGKMSQAGASEGCDFQATLLRLRKDFEGGGFYVLSEYAIPDQGFRMGDEKHGVLLHPVVYQFCANWHGSLKKKEAPPDFDQNNKLCGMRLQFQSETREELAKLPAEHVTTYDRMVELLFQKFGRPANFARRGKVVIETEDGETFNAAERKFSIYRWCPAADRAFNPDCKASVILSINPDTGLGTLLYATPLLWEYAFARENNGFKGDRLFKLLHARK
jgi:hypothetical protein